MRGDGFAFVVMAMASGWRDGDGIALK